MEKDSPPSDGTSHNDARTTEHDSLFSSMATKAKQLWTKTGITWRLYQSMFKGALAPTIAIAGFQATAWAQHYTTLGYLIGIMSVLSLVVQPRAKFVQSMLMQMLLACVAAAIALLACFCCVQARLHTQGDTTQGQGGPGTSGLAAKGAQTATYNSSASVVAGIWLFVEVYAISVLRARKPQYAIPSVMWAVFANVSMTYAPQFSTMAQSEQFVERLLEAYFTGFAIATGVSLFVFPRTSRQVVFEGMRSFISNYRLALQKNLAYLKSLEDEDMFAAQRTRTDGVKPARSPEADAFVSQVQSLSAIQSKLAIDLTFAKREIAFGRMGPDDMQELFRLLRACMVPAVGLSCMSDIFERISQEQRWDRSVSFANVDLDDVENETQRSRVRDIGEWHDLIKLLREPFDSISEAIDEGFEHVMITLRFQKVRRDDHDAEAKGDRPRPGADGFAGAFRLRIEEFLSSKKLMLRGWCQIHGIELPENFFDDPSIDFDTTLGTDNITSDRKRLRRQLMVLLYVDTLLYYTAERVDNLLKFAEELKSSGKLSHSRLVVPGFKRLKKWLHSSLIGQQDSHEDDAADFENGTSNIELGQAFRHRKDPDHLEPTTMWERWSNQLRKIAQFFNSPASHFGFRVALAVMSLAVVNLLRDTQVFFTKNRLFWAQIMISIGMTPSAGQSLRAFVLRILGTFFAMILALIAYYIVDGQVAGVLVFLFCFLHCGNYILLTRPTLVPVGIIMQVTIVLIVGYQLQVRKVGIEAATSNGQAYYPLWQLGLIRLATVTGGLAVAWIWTIFPYPVTEHSQVRKNLAGSLYLVASYYSCVHETVQVRLRGAEGDMTSKESPGRQLEKQRQKIFSKCFTLLSGLRAQAGFVKYDIPIGGKWPRAQYAEILQQLQSTLNYISLISVASSTFTKLQGQSVQGSGSEWLRNFKKIIGEAKLTSHSVTTLLCLLSAAVSAGNPLPPYLQMPEPFQLTERLDQIDTDILSVRHIAEPGYASFAVIQLATKCLVEDIEKLLEGVKELVGELDFSYHIVSTNHASPNSRSEEALPIPSIRLNGQVRNKED